MSNKKTLNIPSIKTYLYYYINFEIFNFIKLKIYYF